MKLINETKYPTRTLRSLIEAIHTSEAKNGRGGRLHSWKRLVIRVSYAKKGNRHYTGHAYLSGRQAHLSVRREKIGVEEFAALWRHELWHLYGIRHDDFPPNILWCRLTEWSAQWTERFGVLIEEQVEEPATAQERKSSKVADTEKKLASAEARLKRWETKAKRAVTGIKSAERDIKRLRKRLTDAKLRPVETFERAARPKKKPDPVPEGMVRIAVTLTPDQGAEVDNTMTCHLESKGSYDEEGWARIERWNAALDKRWHKRRGSGGRLVVDMTAEDAKAFIRDLGTYGCYEVGGWDRALEKMHDCTKNT